MLRLRVLFSLITLMLACSKPKPRIVEVDEDFERNLKMWREDTEIRARENSIVLLIERDQQRHQLAAYRKNVKTVPEKYLLRDPKNPSSQRAPMLWIDCFDSKCELTQYFHYDSDRVLLDNVPRESLTWLASTDLLGLPLEKGGREPLPPAEEGRQLGPGWSPLTRDDAPVKGCEYP